MTNEAKQSHCEYCDSSFRTCWDDGSLCVKKARETKAEKIIKEDGEKLRSLAFEIHRLMEAGSTEKAIEKIAEFREQNYQDANN